MLYVLAALCLLLAVAAAAPRPPKLLTLHPPAPVPRALKYALLPELCETTPGNAAALYRQAAREMQQNGPSQERMQALDKWTSVPLTEFPREEVQEFLSQCGPAIRTTDAAARCEQCDWGLIQELRQGDFGVAMRDAQATRLLGRLLTLRVRSAAADGRMDQAVRALQTGLALARHVADAPMFIPMLVAVAVGAIMLARLEECIQRPNAPDFYWPLTDLPQPFFDLRKPIQGERVYAHVRYPGAAKAAADPNTRPWSSEQAGKVTARLRQDLADGPTRGQSVSDEAWLLRRLEPRHEEAKRTLIADGRPTDLVNAMPSVQVALLVAFRLYDGLLDEYMKAQNLPYWEALPAVEKAEQRRKASADDPNGPALPLAPLLLATVKQMFSVRSMTDRSIAALRCVEAVRLHAGREGRLPESLDEIRDLPPPRDPYTGGRFDYRLAGDRAFLRCPPVPGQPLYDFNAPNYDLIFNS